MSDQVAHKVTLTRRLSQGHCRICGEPLGGDPTQHYPRPQSLDFAHVECVEHAHSLLVWIDPPFHIMEVGSPERPQKAIQDDSHMMRALVLGTQEEDAKYIIECANRYFTLRRKLRQLENRLRSGEETQPGTIAAPGPLFVPPAEATDLRDIHQEVAAGLEKAMGDFLDEFEQEHAKNVAANHESHLRWLVTRLLTECEAKLLQVGAVRRVVVPESLWQALRRAVEQETVSGPYRAFPEGDGRWAVELRASAKSSRIFARDMAYDDAIFLIRALSEKKDTDA